VKDGIHSDMARLIKDPLGNVTTLMYFPTGLINTITDANREGKPGTDRTFPNIADTAQAIFGEETRQRPVCPQVCWVRFGKVVGGWPILAFDLSRHNSK
jgi:hypothetical protein